MSKNAFALNSVNARHGTPIPTDSNANWERQPMTIYRRIYEQHHGSIPKGYHIHHIDGNHSNNDPSNLVAVTAKEHYDIHYSQGDYGACWAMYRTGHLTLTPEERSLLVSKQQQELMKKNKHPFQKSETKDKLKTVENKLDVKKISDEVGADVNGLYLYLGNGFSKVDAICVFAKVFLKAQTPQNQQRLKKILDYIKKFENQEFAKVN